MSDNEIPDEKDIKNILNKRKWKKVANVLKDKNLEKEPEEDGNMMIKSDNFSKNFKESLKKYGEKLYSKWDESGQIEYTPFNMKEEMQEGDLDKEGNFLRRKTNNFEYDPWYESVKGELKKKEYINFLNKQKLGKIGNNLIVEDQEQIESDEEEPTEKIDKKLTKEEKFFRNDKKLDKKKKSFKFHNDEDDEVEGEVGEFFKEEVQTPMDKYEIKKQIKRLRIKLMKLVEPDQTVEKTLQILKKNKEKSKTKKSFQKKTIKEEKKKIEEDIIIENITKGQQSAKYDNKDIVNKEIDQKQKELKENDTRFEQILELISKLTDLQHYTVYSDSSEKILKEYPMINYQFYYRLEYKNKQNNTDQEFGPFDYESITNWIDNNLLNDSEEYMISYKVKSTNFETNWFDRNDVNFKIYL